MTTTIHLGALAGAGAGALLGYLKFRSALAGVLIGAACGCLLVYLFSGSPAAVIAVQTPQEFEQNVLESDAPVLVDFYATWCPPCKKLAPTIEQLASDYQGRIQFVKVDIDKGAALADFYGVHAVPTVILFVKGEPVQQWQGNRPADHYRQALDSVARRQ